MMERKVVFSLPYFARKRYTDKGLSSEFPEYQHRSFEELIFTVLFEPDIFTDTCITYFSLIHENSMLFFIEFIF